MGIVTGSKLVELPETFTALCSYWARQGLIGLSS
jgi:hypothetical protein